MSFWRLQQLIIAFMLGWLGCAVQGQRLAAQKCAEYQNTSFDAPSLIPQVTKPLKFRFFGPHCNTLIRFLMGGQHVRVGEFPHHALLGFRKGGVKKWHYEFRCGGTLISEQYVLTAAHCFVDGDPEIVRLGEYNTEKESHAVLNSYIDSILRHPNHTFYESYHDIALIKLKNPIRLSRHIHPACLWETEKRNNTRYIATGFGYYETFGTKLSTIMLKVQLDELDTSDCERRFKNDRLFKQGIQDGQLCVGSSDGRDTCPGDSGGPLQVVINSKACTYAVVGITSVGGTCGIDVSRSVYTKVSYYIDWIKDNVWGAYRT